MLASEERDEEKRIALLRKAVAGGE